MIQGGWGGGEGGGGEGGGDTMIFANAACSDDSSFFLKDRSSLQYFITQGMGQSSMFHTFHTICNFRGGGLRLWVGWEEGKEEF